MPETAAPLDPRRGNTIAGSAHRRRASGPAGVQGPVCSGAGLRLHARRSVPGIGESAAPRPPPRVALQHRAHTLHHARRGVAEGEGPVAGRVEPVDRTPCPLQRAVRRTLPGPSSRGSACRAVCAPAGGALDLAEHRATLLDHPGGGAADRETPAPLLRVWRSRHEADGVAGRCRRTGHPRVNRLARDQQQVHGDATGCVRAEVLFLPRPVHGGREIMLRHRDPWPDPQDDRKRGGRSAAVGRGDCTSSDA